MDFSTCLNYLTRKITYVTLVGTKILLRYYELNNVSTFVHRTHFPEKKGQINLQIKPYFAIKNKGPTMNSWKYYIQTFCYKKTTFFFQTHTWSCWFGCSVERTCWRCSKAWTLIGWQKIGHWVAALLKARCCFLPLWRRSTV